MEHRPDESEVDSSNEEVSQELIELVGSGDPVAIQKAIEELKEVVEEMPVTGRMLSTRDREFVIPVTSHEQKERALSALYDLSIFPWEENGELIIENKRDLSKLRASKILRSSDDYKGAVTSNIPPALAKVHVFPTRSARPLSDRMKEFNVKSKTKEFPESVEEIGEPGIDTEIKELIDKFDQGQVESDDPKFVKTIGFLPTLRLFPRQYVWEKGKAINKRTGEVIDEDARMALMEKARAGDAKAMGALMRMHTGIVLDVLTRIKQRSGGDPDDLFQAGMIGLIEAIAKHDSSLGKFSTYAYIRVEQAVAREAYIRRHPIHRPAHVSQWASQLRSAKDTATKDNVIDPGLVFEEIQSHRTDSGPRKERNIPANGVGLDRLERMYMLNSAFDPVSDDENNPIDAAIVTGAIEERGQTDMEQAIDEQDMRTKVSQALATLTSREEQVLRRRFGIGVPEMTLEQIGDEYGVTRERIRQIEAKALRVLKHPSRSRALRWLVDPAQAEELQKKRLRELKRTF